MFRERGHKKAALLIDDYVLKNYMDRSKVLPVLDGGGEDIGTSTRPDFQTKKKMEEYHSHTVSIYGVSSKQIMLSWRCPVPTVDLKNFGERY